MARVTVEDCVTKIPNRFELVMTAAQRARDISAGAALTMDRDNDKNPVVSLREIAEETIDYDVLQETLIKSLQRHVESDEPEMDEMEGEGDSVHQDVVADEAEEAASPQVSDELKADVLFAQDVSEDDIAADEASSDEGTFEA